MSDVFAFLAGGMGLVAVVASGIWFNERNRRLADEFQRLAREDPLPLLNRFPDWRTGRIRSIEFGRDWNASMLGGMVFLIGFLPAGYVAWHLHSDEGRADDRVLPILAALILLGLGATFFLMGLYRMGRWIKFAGSSLNLAEVPIPFGAAAEAVLVVPITTLEDTEVELTLHHEAVSYTRTVTRRGGHNRGKVDVQVDSLHRMQVIRRPGAGALRLPITLQIPPTGHPSDFPAERMYRSLMKTWYRWRLEVRAALPGIDYHESFLLPVFSVDRSSIRSLDP